MAHCPSHKSRPGGTWIWLGLLLSLSGSLASAQTVVLHLRNGDRLTGRFLAESTNSVEIATDFAPRLIVPASLIEKREVAPTPSPGVPAPPPVEKPPATNQVIRPAVPASGVVGELVPTNKPALPPSAAAAKAKPPPPEVAAKPPEPSAFRKFLSDWRGEAQLGANLGFSTKDRKTFTSRIKFTHNHSLPKGRALRNILGYDTSYGTTDGVLSDNRMEGNWKVEFDLSKRFLTYNVIAAGYDEIRAIDLEYDFGPGLGYKWVVLTNFVFKTELGGDYQEQFFVGDDHRRRYAFRVAEDFWWQITPKLRWDEKLEFYPEVQEVSRYRLRLETNLSYLLRQNLTLTLNVVDLYNTALPPGVSKNDLQVRSLLGIKF